MPANPSLVIYKKVVNWGLTPQSINFAQSSFMGHRVCFTVPVDFMNEYFTWTRYSDELRPTGRFVNAPTTMANIPTFSLMIERCLGTPYTDLDGVATALNYSSSAINTFNDMKRDQCVDNYTWDYSPIPTFPATSSPTGTHYGANDLVMAFVLSKCFGASAVDAYNVVYNLDDAFGMLTSAQLAAAIQASMQEEEALAAAAVLPAKEVSNQLPGDNKGQVDAMFRSLLSIDPQRFYKNGQQIQGLFETNYVCSSSFFTASIAEGATPGIYDSLVVSAISSGRLSLGDVVPAISGAMDGPLIIIGMATGTMGGVGTYTLSSGNTLSSTAASVLSQSMVVDTDVQGFVGSVATSGGVSTLTLNTILTGTLDASFSNNCAINGTGIPRGTTMTRVDATHFTLNFPSGFNNSGLTLNTRYFTGPTPDPDATGNWCLTVGDKIEVPVKLYFRAPVTVLSVIDGAKNASSATPDQVETIFIKGEAGAAFDSKNSQNIADAERGNVMAIRLQIVCGTPAISPPLTRSTSEVPGLGLTMVNKSNLIFYKGNHYPVQSSLGVAVAGGTAPYTYEFTANRTYDQITPGSGITGPPFVTLSSSGLFTFYPTQISAAAGKWKSNITITDSTGANIDTDIYIDIDDTLQNNNSVPYNETTLYGLSSTSINASGFTIHWSGGIGATSYTYKLNNSPATPSSDNGMASNAATFSGLTGGTLYSVLVTAMINGVSIDSNTLTITTLHTMSAIDNSSNAPIISKDIITLTNYPGLTNPTSGNYTFTPIGITPISWKNTITDANNNILQNLPGFVFNPSGNAETLSVNTDYASTNLYYRQAAHYNTSFTIQIQATDSNGILEGFTIVFYIIDNT